MLISKNTKPRKSKKGFTLLEVIIAFALISIFLIPISNLILNSVKINKLTENKQQAKAVLQDTVENLKSIENISPCILTNGVALSDATSEEGKSTYSLSGDINGFSIEGTITEKSQVTSNKSKEINIDRAIYFNGNSISVSSGASTIEAATEKSSSSLALKGNEVSIKVTDTKSISIIYGDIKNEINISNPKNNAVLLCVDGEATEDSRLKLNIENNIDTEKLKVYLYNRAKTSEREDIIISNLKGPIELITGMQSNEESSNSKLFSVELKAKKNNEVIETMTFDMVK